MGARDMHKFVTCFFAGYILEITLTGDLIIRDGTESINSSKERRIYLKNQASCWR